MADKTFGPAYIADKMDEDRVLYSYASFWSRQGENLKSALKAAETCVKLKGQPYHWNTLADVHWKLGDLKAAKQALEEAMDLQPSNVYYRNRMKQLKNLEVDDRELVRIEAIINSMTPEERRRFGIINGSRRKRIAKGSGTSVQDVNKLLKNYAQVMKMMKKFSKGGMRGMRGMLPF